MGHTLCEFFSSWKWLKLDKVESYFLSILWKYCVLLQRLRRCLSDSCSFVDDIFLLSWGSSLETLGSLSLKFHYNVHRCRFSFFSFTVLAQKGTQWTLLIYRFVPFSSVQSLSHVQLFAALWTAAHQASMSITNSQSQTPVPRVSDVIQTSHPLSSPSLRAFSSSQHQGLAQESVLCIRWPKYWSCSFTINPSNEYWGLISFRMDWFDLLAVQGTLESLLQHHSSKASVLRCSAFFIVQLSHPYMTTGKTGKTIALTRQTFVGRRLCFLICCLGWS